MLHRASNGDRFFGTTQAMENGHEILTWNVSLYRAGSLKTVASKLMNYKLHLLAVQEFRVKQQMIIHFPMEMTKLIIV
jgi:exonuclease III